MPATARSGARSKKHSSAPSPPALGHPAEGQQRVRSGGAEEAPPLTAAARDGDGNVRSGWKNARGAGRTKEWSNNARQKWRDAPLTKKAPYKPDAGNRHVRFDERGWETERRRMAQATAPILDSTNRCHDVA